jgi:hypothetical protein
MPPLTSLAPSIPRSITTRNHSISISLNDLLQTCRVSKLVLKKPYPVMSSPSATSSSRAAAKPQRVLACVLCQHRKVRCNRKFPCSNCEKAGAQCIPATLAQRQRRRRFPERELLERLRDYECLLRQNNIPFEPLHPPAAEKPSSTEVRDYDSIDDTRPQGSEATTIKSETAYEAKLRFLGMSKVTILTSSQELLASH